MKTNFLSRTLENERAPVGILGRPVSSFYEQLHSFVSERLGPEIAGYFAEPVMHEDDGGVDWFSNCAEKPVPLADLKKSERVAVLEVLKNWQEKLRALQVQTEHESPEMHQILTLVLNEPSLQDVFVCGGKPILTNWGYATPADFVSFSYSNNPEIQQPLPPLAAEHSGQKPNALTVSMLAALALSLLVGGLALSGVIRADTGFLPAPQDELDTDALFLQQETNARLRAEIKDLQGTYTDLILACAQNCSPPIPAPEPEPEPEVLDPLVIPDDTSNTAFLEGTWRSTQDTLFLDNETEDPLTIEYQIDSNGNGIRSIEIEDGRICEGKITAFFNSSGALIIQDMEPAICSNGTGINDYTVTCNTDQGSRAVCTMSSNDPVDTDSPISVELRRLK